MPKEEDSFREASRVASHTALPETLVVLAMKIPHLDKLLRAGKIRMVGHPTSKKGAEVMTRLKTSTVRKLHSFSQSVSQRQPRFKGDVNPYLAGKCSKHILQRRWHTGKERFLQSITGKERKTTDSEVKVSFLFV